MDLLAAAAALLSACSSPVAPTEAALRTDTDKPAACSGELSTAVWSWCRDVVAWINHEYAWRPAQMVPACWSHHAHIARELPVLVVLRWEAESAAGPQLMEEWNRYAFPMFCERMAQRLGESTCRVGRHQDWPAESRYTAFLDASAR